MTTAPANPPHRVIVIGNGMVGHHFVTTMSQMTTPEQVSISVFSEEPHPAYDRVHLSEVFSGTDALTLRLADPVWYAQNNISLHLDQRVVAVDTGARRVQASNGQWHDYDALVFATGSYPFVPPISGNDHPNCCVYRTLEDLDQIQALARKGKTGVVVGGGLLGLEAANALRNLGLATHVVEFAPQLMPVQLDAGGGAVLKDKIEALGVQVHTRKSTQQIVPGEETPCRMLFADGTSLDTDVIVFSAGIRPQDSLARQAGIPVGERGGIVIDNHCQTALPGIYAIGECALWDGRIYGLVAPGYRMAEAAAAHLAGSESSFTGADMSTKLKLLGVDVGSIGDAHGKLSGAQTYVYINEPDGVYKKLVVSPDRRQLWGAVLVGDNSDYDTLLQYSLNGIELPDDPHSLILPRSEGKPALGADALPANATICSCHNVSKSAIADVMQAGCCQLADIKTQTRASTGCGGCAALLKNVVDCELTKQGIAVNNHLCEHFAHSRQELFHILQVEDYKTFDQLLSKHGKGRGCDICKPAVGSMLASLHNDYILNQEHVGLQDTNDTFLANMQKDGTYSIVPRIPGGEITPARLAVLADVAERYQLYTKITGGQRIDLFGARLEQLPEIWRILVDAGFETGHAYGKALRTVKSCVGSTWCRYGVQDSVGMAITLENRYKGLRAPHKLKFAVSGCTRECAEAQSKDIGVIATENGWNLYVCGNGGMRPRHADLFATDLDDNTLIRYIDRILMFYVRTGDRLQRTSVWMENLEGGLDYLRTVVIDDALHLAEQLEQQMATLIERYQCEWKTTLEDEQRLKRFRSFVNSDEQDPNIQFVDERGQRRPARDTEKRLVRLVNY